MKTIWKLIIVSAAVGLLLIIYGVAAGASRTIYLDNTGIHLSPDSIDTSGSVSEITELNLGYFDRIEIDADFCDVTFISSKQYGIDMCGYDTRWDWGLANETLKITQKTLGTRITNPRIQIMNFDWSTPDWSAEAKGNYVKVYLPDNASLKTVTVKIQTGNIKLGGFQADSVQIDNSFGDIELYDCLSNRLSIDLSVGNFSGSRLNVRNLRYNNNFGDGRFRNINAEDFTADGDNGNLELTGCEFTETWIKSRFGKITAKDFISSKTDISADNGNIDLDGAFFGETVIKSSFGNIKLSVKGEKKDYSYDISTKFGEAILDGTRFTGAANSGASGHTLKITSTSGNIEVRFRG